MQPHHPEPRSEPSAEREEPAPAALCGSHELICGKWLFRPQIFTPIREEMSEKVLLLSLLTVAFIYFCRAHLKSPDGSSIDDGRNALQSELYPCLNHNTFVEHTIKNVDQALRCWGT